MGDFDPYHKWLGIRSADQPPDHYRLLGIELFEEDPDVIDAAADQRMSYLRQCNTGPHVQDSQKLLNEVAAARVCLLNSRSKEAYDAKLRRSVEAQKLTSQASPLAIVAQDVRSRAGGGANRTPREAPQIASQEADDEESSLGAWSERLRDLSDRTATTSRRARRNLPAAFEAVRSNRLIIGTVAAIGLAIAASGSAIFFRSAPAAIELENLPNRAEVYVDGTIVAVQWPDPDGAARIAVLSGSRNVLVKESGTEVYRSRIEVGSRQVARAEVPPSRKTAPDALIAPSDVAAVKRVRSAWGKHLDRPVEFTNPSGIKFALIPPGEFQMGSATPTKGGPGNVILDADEFPRHRVVISRPFYLGIHEVTQAQYQAVMYGSNPSDFKQPDHPVENVSWNDVNRFCVALGQKHSRTYRLPTEAEWEYACRAGSDTHWFFGDAPKGLDSYAWNRHNANKETHPVGTLAPNPFGLFDVYGNVREWCYDHYEGKYYSSSTAFIDPRGPVIGATGNVFVTRGGCWDSDADCRSAHRQTNSESTRSARVGFRLLLELPDPPAPKS